MEWRDQGILLNARAHGETSAIIDVFTKDHGRHAGVVRGGRARKMTPVLQPGAQLDLTWRARLEDHLGTFQVELLHSRTALVIGDRKSLSGLNVVTAMLLTFLPERESYTTLYTATEHLLDLIEDQTVWPTVYLKWELALLDILGFGLDLSVCAVTGKAEDLAYISPKTGRAVSSAGAGEWADRLFPFVPVLSGAKQCDLAEMRTAFNITGYFLENHVLKGLGLRAFPAARARFVDTLSQST
tara:strand:- start:115 stop:840 length:726 start_codon:yes stop_codon:yes gene_type:complete